MKRRFLEDCLAEGMSLEAIGELTGRHPSTVSYWLKKHGLRAAGQARHAPKGNVDPARLRELVERGMSIRDIAQELDAGYSTIRHWIRRHEAGGKCALCGFADHPAALQFHHVNPETKEFHLGHQGHTCGIRRMRAEAKKCVLLCANCHAQVEAGAKEVPPVDR